MQQFKMDKMGNKWIFIFPKKIQISKGRIIKKL